MKNFLLIIFIGLSLSACATIQEKLPAFSKKSSTQADSSKHEDLDKDIDEENLKPAELSNELAEPIDDINKVPLINPNIKRPDFKEANIDTEDFEIGAYIGFISIEDFGSESIPGIRIAYHITEDFFVELNQAKTKVGTTAYERLNLVELLDADEREYEYTNVSLGYKLFPGEAFFGNNHAFNTTLYLLAGSGSTKFAGDDFKTNHIGIGYQFLANDWIGIHLNFRDHMFETDLLAENKTTHNLEIYSSLTFFF